jgi:hypothetical protein
MGIPGTKEDIMKKTQVLLKAAMLLLVVMYGCGRKGRQI